MAKSNIATVAGFEINRHLRRKSLWIFTLLVPIAIIAIGLISGLSSAAADSTIAEQQNEQFSFEYVDASGLIDQTIAAQLGGQVASDPASGLEDVKSGRIEAFFNYPADPSQQAIEVAGADVGIVENGRYASVARSLLQASVAAELNDPMTLAIVAGETPVTTTAYRDGQATDGLGRVVAPILYLVIFFMALVMLGNQMLSATLEEKENRVSEMILTTIDATSLLIGKVVGVVVVGLAQMLTLLLPSLGALFFFRENLDLAGLDLSQLSFQPRPMILGLLLLGGGLALYTACLVTIGAIMPTAQDAGPAFSAVILLCVMPLYAIVWVATNPDSAAVIALTLFPLSAPITAMMRNALGVLPLWQAVVALIELYGLAALVLALGTRLFRYGSIAYAGRVNLKAALTRRQA
ncbi:MAG: ABC transporter permease [Propionibacteriaceae bacterium]|jgi:ABC-2 type transport system permease protein|nr:ABC transporter permease [Propionibacteriaceae bacterium]